MGAGTKEDTIQEDSLLIYFFWHARVPFLYISGFSMSLIFIFLMITDTEHIPVGYNAALGYFS